MAVLSSRVSASPVKYFFFFFSSRRRHTRFSRDWSSDVCSSDLIGRSTSRQIAESLGLSLDTKVSDLTDGEITKLRDYIDTNLQVEGDLRRERQQAIKRLGEIGAYRGVRH